MLFGSMRSTRLQDLYGEVEAQQSGPGVDGMWSNTRAPDGRRCRRERSLLNAGVNAAGPRTALWLCDLGTELPLVAG